MKLCKDCKHCNFIIGVGWCEHPRVGVSLISGKLKATRCASMRTPDSLCGIEGNLFEPKLSWFAKLKNSLLNL